MPKLSPISPKKLIALLLKHGFQIKRIHGSHHFLINPQGKTTVVPKHGNEDIGVGLLRKILRDIGWSVQEFKEKL